MSSLQVDYHAWLQEEEVSLILAYSLGQSPATLELSAVLTQFFCSNWREPTDLLSLDTSPGFSEHTMHGEILGSRAIQLAPDSVESSQNAFTLLVQCPEEGIFPVSLRYIYTRTLA